MRCFFALSLDWKQARGLILAARNCTGELPDSVVWQPAENLHLTLAFIGEASPERDVPALMACAESLSGWSLPEVAVGRPAAFPSPRRARLVAVELERAGPLMTLQACLTKALGESGFTLEKRRYRPHITLARIRGRGRLAELPAESVWSQPPLRFGYLQLLSSEPGEGASVYAPLVQWPLEPSV